MTKKDKQAKPVTVSYITACDEYIKNLNYTLEKKNIFIMDATIIEMLKTFLKMDKQIPDGSGGKRDLITINQIFITTQAYREQAIVIKADYLKKQGVLNQLYAKARAYLYTTYAAILYQHRSNDVRSDVVDNILDVLSEKIYLCERILAIAEMVSDVLKDRYFVVCRCQDSIMATMPESVKRNV